MGTDVFRGTGKDMMPKQNGISIHTVPSGETGGQLSYSVHGFPEYAGIAVAPTSSLARQIAAKRGRRARVVGAGNICGALWRPLPPGGHTAGLTASVTWWGDVESLQGSPRSVSTQAGRRGPTMGSADRLVYRLRLIDATRRVPGAPSGGK